MELSKLYMIVYCLGKLEAGTSKYIRKKPCMCRLLGTQKYKSVPINMGFVKFCAELQRRSAISED